MDKKLVALAVVAVAIPAVWWATRSPEAPPEKAADSGAASETPEATPPSTVKVRGMRALGAGRSFVYDVTASRTMGAPDAPTPTLVTKIAGSLSLTVVGEAEEGAAVRVALASPKREDQPARKGGDGAAELATPFFVVMRGDGTITSWHFPRSMPGDSRRQMRSIVSAMEIVTEEGVRPAWERSETDEAGQYVATYAAAGDAITKTKTKYAFVRSPQGLVPVSTIGKYDVSGSARFVLDATGWPASVDEDTKTVVTFQGGTMAMLAKTRARLVSASETREYIGSFEAAQATFDPDPDALAEAAALAAQNADESLVGGASLASLVSDYESASERKGRARAVARMGALLRTKPGTVAGAREKLLSKDTKEATGRALASALGAAGTKEAQRALADALKSKDVPASVKSDAAISLGLTDKPSTEGKNALKSASSEPGDLGATATLALGNMAGKLGRDGQDASDIVDDLLAKLEAATSPEQKVLYLDALGNTGDPRALKAIQARLADESAEVRAAAVSALRFQKSPDVDPAIVIMVRDPEVLVRKAALSAMSQRDLARVFAGLKEAVEKDSVPELRVTAIRILARGLDSVPEIEQLLTTVSQNDPDDTVRKAATEALSRPK